MKYTEQEKVILELIDRVATEYKSMERNETPGTDNERSRFMQGLSLAKNVIEIRALTRK